MRNGKKKRFSSQEGWQRRNPAFSRGVLQILCLSVLLKALFLGAMGGSEWPRTPALRGAQSSNSVRASPLLQTAQQGWHRDTSPPQPSSHPAPQHRTPLLRHIHCLCQERGVFCQPGQAVLEESQGTRGSLLGDHLVLEQIAGICVRCSGRTER